MRTVDVRLLIRAAHDVDQAVEQLLTGVLRVHAAVELILRPSGLLVPSAAIHRNHRSAVHIAAARDWDGRRVAHVTDT